MIQVEDKIKMSMSALFIWLAFLLAYSLVSYATPAINDDTITAIVMSNLETDLGAKAVKIYVNTSNGVVTLSGSGLSADEKFIAEGVTRNTTGVTEVVNRIRVDSKPVSQAPAGETGSIENTGEGEGNDD